jgi:hypothetical protein
MSFKSSEEGDTEDVVATFLLFSSFLRSRAEHGAGRTDHLQDWVAYIPSFLHKAKCISAGVHQTRPAQHEGVVEIVR